jgi:glyoxylase-like metal-dependent hydrolase (beta-lactamase superfamily II)
MDNETPDAPQVRGRKPYQDKMSKDRVYEDGLIKQVVLPLPFPQVQHVNVYLLGKSNYMLIDTGTSTQDSYDILLDYLKTNNIKHIDAIYLTHGHIDHFGAAARLLEDGIAGKVFIHEKEIGNIKNEYNESLYGFHLKRYGIPDDVLEMMKYASVFFDGFAQRLDSVSFIEPGKPILYDGGSLEVIHTPGHTAGSVCLYDRDKGFMLSGDTLLSRLSPNPLLDFQLEGGRRESLVEYINSIYGLYDMELKAVYPGHYEIIHDHRPHIKNLFNFHYKRMMRIHNIIKQKPMTPYEIAHSLFKRLHKPDVFLAVSEIVGHLDLLEHHDMVRSFEEEGLLYYTAI